MDGHDLNANPGNAYGWTERFLSDMLYEFLSERGLSTKHLPQYRFVTDTGEPCVGTVELIVRSGDPHWKIDFGKELECKTTIVNAPPGAQDISFSVTLSGALLFGLGSQFKRDTKALKLDYEQAAEG